MCVVEYAVISLKAGRNLWTKRIYWAKRKNLINHIWKTFLIIQIYTAKNSLPPIYSSLDDRRAEWHLVRVKWVQWYYNGVIVLVWRSSHVILTWAISAAPQKNGTRKKTLGITETNNEAKKKLFFHMIMRGLKHKYKAYHLNESSCST